MRTFRLLLPCFGFLSLAVTACGLHDKTPAKPEYAIMPNNAAFSGPIGRLTALKLGFKTDFTQLRICVETGRTHIADDELMLETRMAYAAWLDAATGFTESDWQKFVFVASPKCDFADASYGGVVVAANEGESLPAGNSTNFSLMQLSCNGGGCQSNGITTGLGGPGSLSYSYNYYDPGKWTGVSSNEPAFATLSPNVDWISLDQDLGLNQQDGLSDAAKAELKAEYQSLKAETAPTMAALAGFVKKLAAQGVLQGPDTGFENAMNTYETTGQTVGTFRSSEGIFHTLLHEVGHQYGMDHADNPDGASTTGPSLTTQKGPDGQYRTSRATMAYGDPYLYLTDDDVAGIRSVRSSVVAYLQSHR